MNNRPIRLLELSGPIASGKSTVRQMFESFGVCCLEIDAVIRGMHQDPEHPALLALAKQFPQLIDAHGKLRRGSLVNYFSHHPKDNHILKSIFLPYLYDYVQSWMQQHRWDAEVPFVVCESAIDLRASVQTLPDKREQIVWRRLVVDAPLQQRIDRLRRRHPSWTLDDVRRMLDLQESMEQYRTNADELIHNDGNVTQLRSAVERLFQAYKITARQ